ncbi:outer membrane OMP85 family protein [Actinidia rufa]|uniref:Outer membrane OMP85 family protein n=1 Tax=Actinidia rufa TaxID=165716 RepID=A0A7J0HAY5_9ERIC|nr:outer membrane OMP85 family protein [Actinidia rufa]
MFPFEINDKGAQISICAGKAKVDLNVDFQSKLDAALMLLPFSLCIKHPNLFGRSKRLDVPWVQPTEMPIVIQHSISPEIGIHGLPVDNFSYSESGGVNLSRFSIGIDLDQSASSNWTNKTSLILEHVRPINDDGRSISRDLDGFPVTASGSNHDSAVVLKQESQFVEGNEFNFKRFSLQIEQAFPVTPQWRVFNRFKFVASKGVKLGPAFLLTRLMGGSSVGDIAPYQGFPIGGVGSVRGYGEGAVGTGRSFLVANSELTISLVRSNYLIALWVVQSSLKILKLAGWECEAKFKKVHINYAYFIQNQMVEGAIFLDCGTDLYSGRHVPELRIPSPPNNLGFVTSSQPTAQVSYGLRNSPKRKSVVKLIDGECTLRSICRDSRGNPALRQGKPGHGIGHGYGLRFKSPVGDLQVDYAINSFQQKTVYFSFSNLCLNFKSASKKNQKLSTLPSPAFDSSQLSEEPLLQLLDQ